MGPFFIRSRLYEITMWSLVAAYDDAFMKIERGGHRDIQNNYLGLTNLGCEKDIIEISPFFVVTILF